MKPDARHLDQRVLPTPSALLHGITCFFLRQHVRSGGRDDTLITRISLSQTPQPVMPLNAWDVSEKLESDIHSARMSQRRESAYLLDPLDMDLSEQFFSPRFICDPAEVTRGSNAEWLTLAEIVKLASADPAWVLGTSARTNPSHTALAAYEAYYAQLAAGDTAGLLLDDSFCDPVSPAAEAPRTAQAAERTFFVGTETSLTEYEQGKRSYALLTCEIVAAPRWFRTLRSENEVALCHRMYLASGPEPLIVQSHVKPLSQLHVLASAPDVNWWPQGEFARRIQESLGDHRAVTTRHWFGLLRGLSAPRP